MLHLPLAALLAAPLLANLPQDGGPVDAAAQDAAAAPLGPEMIARCPGQVLTRAAYHEALLWRHARSPQGQAALKGLLELRVIETLAAERGLEASREEIDGRIADLERQVVAGGQAESIVLYLEQQGIDPLMFREYMRLALLHEKLTRHALKLDADSYLTGEMQTRWLEGEMKSLGRVDGAFPWDRDPVVTCGGAVITRDELLATLENELPLEDQRKLATELLLARKLRKRVPDLTDEAIAAGMEPELERRKQRAAQDPRYKGADYLQLLSSQGLDLEALRRDPAVRVSVMAHLFVDRAHPGDAMRAVYEAEREFFDGLFGEGVTVSVLVLNAARFANDLVPRDFATAEAELTRLKDEITSLEDFQRLTLLHSEDTGTRERQGLLGVVTRGAVQIPEPMREAAFAVLDAGQEPDGKVLGPVRLQGSVVLMYLGDRVPAPTWEVMRDRVHNELRRRLIAETLPADSVTTRFDPTH